MPRLLLRTLWELVEEKKQKKNVWLNDSLQYHNDEKTEIQANQNYNRGNRSLVDYIVIERSGGQGQRSGRLWAKGFCKYSPTSSDGPAIHTLFKWWANILVHSLRIRREFAEESFLSEITTLPDSVTMTRKTRHRLTKITTGKTEA